MSAARASARDLKEEADGTAETRADAFGKSMSAIEDIEAVLPPKLGLLIESAMK